MGSIWPPGVGLSIIARVYKGRFRLQNRIQAVLIFATKLFFKETALQSKHQHYRAGERGPRASREEGDGAHRGREGGKLYPDRIGVEVVATGAGSVRG